MRPFSLRGLLGSLVSVFSSLRISSVTRLMAESTSKRELGRASSSWGSGATDLGKWVEKRSGSEFIGILEISDLENKTESLIRDDVALIKSLHVLF